MSLRCLDIRNILLLHRYGLTGVAAWYPTKRSRFKRQTKPAKRAAVGFALYPTEVGAEGTSGARQIDTKPEERERLRTFGKVIGRSIVVDDGRFAIPKPLFFSVLPVRIATASAYTYKDREYAMAFDK